MEAAGHRCLRHLFFRQRLSQLLLLLLLRLAAMQHLGQEHHHPLQQQLSQELLLLQQLQPCHLLVVAEEAVEAEVAERFQDHRSMGAQEGLDRVIGPRQPLVYLEHPLVELGLRLLWLQV